MRNRGVSKLYLAVGLFMTLVVALVVVRVVTANRDPQRSITREKHDANRPATTPVAPTLEPSGSGSADLDRGTESTPEGGSP